MRNVALFVIALAAGAAFSATALAATPAKKKPKVGMAFHYSTASGGTPIAADFKSKGGPSIGGGSVQSVEMWFVTFRGDVKGETRALSISIPKSFLAPGVTFPVTLDDTNAGSVNFSTTHPIKHETPEITGYWGRGAGSTVQVELTSWDPKKRIITGTFTMTLSDAATFLTLDPLVVTGGTFVAKLPK